MIRKFSLVAALALCLAACGGETYPLPASQAYASLSSVGVPDGANLLSAMSGVSMNVESLPDDSSVRWSFSHDGDDLGAIIARVDADGEQSSTITTDYVAGSAPDDRWKNGKMRDLIQGGMRQLIEEGVRAHFENRPFDMAMRRQIEVAALQANMGALMNDITKSRDEAAARFDERDHERESSRATNPNNATRPMTDLEHRN